MAKKIPNLLFFLIAFSFISFKPIENSAIYTTDVEMRRMSEQEFLFHITIQSQDQNGVPRILCKPRLICLQNNSAKVTIEGEEQSVCVNVTIPENLDEGIQCQVEVLKNSKLIYSSFCSL